MIETGGYGRLMTEIACKTETLPSIINLLLFLQNVPRKVA
jgi:hypothetical protein